MTFKNRPRPFHNRPTLHNSLPNGVRDQTELMYRAGFGGPPNFQSGGGQTLPGRLRPPPSSAQQQGSTHACFSMTITQLQAPGPKPAVKPRTAPVVKYPKLRRRPTTRHVPVKPKKEEPEEQVEDPVVGAETCVACLMILEYGLSESDLDSMAPCLEDASSRDDSSDYRDELVIESFSAPNEKAPGLNGRNNDTSKALYYTLASSTVLEKNNFNGSARELDNVFLAAAKYGDMDILLRTLDRHSININVRDEENGDTALILAAKGNNPKVVEALVERGADVTVLNEDGKGALDIASNFLKLSVLSKYPKNPAHTGVAVVKAAWQGDIVSLKNILATHSGSKLVDMSTDEGLTPLLVVTRDVNTFLRLQRSVKLNYDPAKVIQELLKHKANVNATDMEGHTALHFATRISAQKLCRDIVDLLLVYKPLLNMLDRTNLTPLHTATNNDNAAVVSALVEAGANPNLHGIGGATPLHIGAQQENEDIIRKLVLAGGDVNALDRAGMTPLCVARSNKIRELMKSLFASLAAEQGMEVKLKYDELSSKRKFQKLLETAAVQIEPEVVVEREEIIPIEKPPDFRHLQRALIKDTQRGSYDYDVSKRVPRLVEGKKVTLDYSSHARRQSTDKNATSLLPRIEPKNAVLLLKRHSPIEVPVLQRNQSRLRDMGRGVFITQGQASRAKKGAAVQSEIPKTRPPIPKHTCGFVKPERNGSAKRSIDRTSNVSLSGQCTPNNMDTDQWLPGAPIILASSSDNSRPTSAVTGSSSQSQRGPKIHLKNVLKNILANMEKSGSPAENLLDRYVQQQRPIKVKEMGFVEFLLQDDDPEKRSQASSSTRSNHFSDSSSVSGMSATSSAFLTENSPAPPPIETIAVSRITIGETTPQLQPLNLPHLRQLPAPAPDHPLRTSQNERKSSLEVPRPHELALRRNSTDDGRRMSIVTISSPYNSPTETNPKISSRSSRDSGYGGSLATLLNRSQQSTDSQESEEVVDKVSRPGTAELHPPKHVTAVVVNNQEVRSEESETPATSEEKSEEGEECGEENGEDTKSRDSPEQQQEEEEEDRECQMEPGAGSKFRAKRTPGSKPQQDSISIVGITNIGVLQGQRMKTVPKLSNTRPINKFKEHTFKKKIYSRKLPQIKEESRSRQDSAVSRFKNRERQTARSARSGTSESSNETTYQIAHKIEPSRPGTVPNKPVLGLNMNNKTKQRPKTSGYNKVEVPGEKIEDPDKIPDEQIEKEIKEITNKHDRKLIKRLSSLKDLNQIVSSTPLKVEKKIPEHCAPAPPTIEIDASSPVLDDADNVNNYETRSMYSERRSAITTFTATTRIESIMGETTQWKKGRLLGSGGGGKVWYGMTQEKIEVAVKQLELSTEQDDAKEEYHELQEEIKLLKCLKHDNIVRYYGTCLQDNFINIFMEYVEGGSLAARIKKQGGSLQERTIQNFTYQLLDALKYIHAKNIVHRDIKGQNILVTPDDRVKLIDFGCGKRLRRSLQNTEALKTMRGTPYWMSPEVITGSGHGIKSDVWSLSCTVYEMLTGNPPWHSLPTMAAIYKIGTGRPIPSYPDNASDYCIDFMKACFVVDTKARPSAEDLLKHEFIELFSNRIQAEKERNGRI